MNGFEKRKLAKMENIEKTVFSLMNQTALDKISMEKIASTAKVSKVTLFNYYGNKDNLVNTVMTNTLASISQGYREILEKDLPFEESYLAILHYKIETLQLMSPVFVENILFQFKQEDSFYQGENLSQSHDLFLTLIQKGRSEGKVNETLSDETILLYFDIFAAGIQKMNLSSQQLFDFSEAFGEMFLKSLS